MSLLQEIFSEYSIIISMEMNNISIHSIAIVKDGDLIYYSSETLFIMYKLQYELSV